MTLVSKKPFWQLSNNMIWNLFSGSFFFVIKWCICKQCCKLGFGQAASGRLHMDLLHLVFQPSFRIVPERYTEKIMKLVGVVLRHLYYLWKHREKNIQNWKVYTECMYGLWVKWYDPGVYLFFISVTVKWSYKIYTLCLLKVVTESMFSYANPVIKLYSAFVSSGESCEND